MAYLRLLLLTVAVIGFYLFGTPVQRLALRRGWRLAGRLPVFFHQTMCRLLRVRVHFDGSLSAAGPLLIVSNHLSWLDIPALSTGELVSFLSKREVKSWPVFGSFAVLQGSVFVDRARAADVPKVNAEIARRLLAGSRIVLFAEGTTGDGSGVLPFRAAHFGAAEAALAIAPQVSHVSIQPVAIAYMSRDGHTTVPWYGDMEFLPHLWSIVRGGPYDCMISFGEPIRFDRTGDRKAVAAAAEAAVRRLFERSRELLMRNSAGRPGAAGTAILLESKRP